MGGPVGSTPIICNSIITVRNIFFFVRRYAVLLFFLMLQGFCIYLIVTYNRYHHSMFSSTANQITGKVNAQYNKVEDYFHLKKTNDSLWKANERLLNQLRQDFLPPDTSSRSMIDTVQIDSIKQYRRYNYLQSTVVANSVVNESNYIVLGRGSAAGMKEGMGVVDINNGVIGVVREVTTDYSVVMSLLHKDSINKIKRMIFLTKVLNYLFFSFTFSNNSLMAAACRLSIA